jgi:hypothetical protein
MCVCFDVHIVSNLVGRVVGGIGKILMEVDLFITAFFSAWDAAVASLTIILDVSKHE